MLFLIKKSTAFLSSVYAVLAKEYPLLGPVFPSPQDLSAETTIVSVGGQLANTLNGYLDLGQTPYGNYTPKATSVSITITSALDGSSFFDYQYTSSFLNKTAGSTSKVTKDSVYRVGSISKLFTVYALLLNNGFEYWDRPVTDFVPELGRFTNASNDVPETDRVLWEEVTIGSLASQLSGIGRDSGFL